MEEFFVRKRFEKGTTTIGLVWTPSYVEGLAVTLDYSQIEIEDVISNVSASIILLAEYSILSFTLSKLH